MKGLSKDGVKSMADTLPKAQVEFFVAKGEDNIGPLTIERIAERIAKSEFAVTDFVYDDSRADWIPLMECEALKAHLRRAKPKAPPPGKSAQQATAPATAPAPAAAPVVTAAPAAAAAPAPAPTPVLRTEAWYVQKSTERHGPFTYHELVRCLQEKTVYDFDFVWKDGMDSWVRIAEHEMFQPERIRQLASQIENNEQQVFLKRQHARLRFESEVIVHDGREVWMGQSYQASVGGSGLVIENATLNPGQMIRLHFAPCDGLPAFNALGEVVGKQFTKDIKGAKSPVKYSVRFLKLDGSAEPQVREYFANSSARN